MKHWLIIGLTYWDRLIVHANVLEIKNGVAEFYGDNQGLIFATKLFTSILPVSNDEYYSDRYIGVAELNKERK